MRSTCPRDWRIRPRAVEQIAFADIILLNKTDLVGAEALPTLERRIRSVNPTAKIIRTERSAAPLDKILGQHAFDLERVTELDPHFLPDHDCDPGCDHHHDDDHAHDHHHHDDHVGASGISSVSLSTEKALNPDRVLPWLNQITQERGPDILRLKGILAFPDEPKRFVVQGVHMILEGDVQRDWKDGEKRISRLVFIGRNLDRKELEAPLPRARRDCPRPHNRAQAGARRECNERALDRRLSRVRARRWKGAEGNAHGRHPSDRAA